METKRLYEFGDFRLDVAERLLLRDGAVVAVKAKVFDMLVLLVENAGHLLEKERLLKELWPDSFVEEVNLNVNISALRKALGETPSDPQYIETIPKRGYRFIAEVTERREGDYSATVVLTDQSQARHISHEAVSDDAVDGETGRSKTEFKTPSSYVTAPLTGRDSQVVESSKTDLAEAARARDRRSKPRARLIAATILLLILIVGAGIYSISALRSKDRSADAADVRTIAVLPFKTSATDEINSSLGLGMADALITRLSRLQKVTVRSTSSVQKYADAEHDPVEAGKALGVEAVLTGFVQRDGKNIRISTQMLRVSDSSTLWAEKFDDFFTNVFAVQDRISEKMVDALSMRLTRGEQQLLTKRYTENTEAYQLYMQGKYYDNRATPDGYAKAEAYYKAAIKKDPEYALARAALAGVYFALGEYADRLDMRVKAGEEVATALRLDPDLSEAHQVEALLIFLDDWDWAGAELSIKRAVELNPNNAEAHAIYSWILSSRGRHEEAIGESERARQLDPISVSIISSHTYALVGARRYDEAIEQATKLVEMEPRSVQGHRLLGMIYNQQSRFAEAIAEFEKEVDLGGYLKSPMRLGYAYARAGKRAEAERVLRERMRSLGKAGSNYYGIAMIHAGLGNKDRAFEFLEKAYEARELPMIYITQEREWDLLRLDARFADLLRRMRLAP